MGEENEQDAESKAEHTGDNRYPPKAVNGLSTAFVRVQKSDAGTGDASFRAILNTAVIPQISQGYHLLFAEFAYDIGVTGTTPIAANELRRLAQTAQQADGIIGYIGYEEPP